MRLAEERNEGELVMSATYNDAMFREQFEHGYTWLNGFARNVRRYAARPAILDPLTGRSWNYRQLNAEANRLAHALRRDGVGKNDVVMAALANCPELCFAYIGPRKVGGILNLANYNLSAGELALLIDHNRPKVLLYSASVVKMVAQAVSLAKYPPAKAVMADNLKDAPLPEGHICYEDYVRDQSEEDPEMDFVPHIYDEVLRLCTSGTTALPKSVPLNDINEVLSAHDIIMHFPLNCTDVTMNMTPWFHRGGCHCGGPCPTFYLGSSLVCMRSYGPSTALRWVEEYGITFLVGSPAALEMLARTQEKNNFDLSSLRGLVTMGAPLEKEACIRYLKVLTPNLFNGYGTTESLWNSFLRPYDLPQAAGSVGGSCIDDEVRVVRAVEGGKAEPDELVAQDGKTVGEVILCSPGKCSYSYYNNPEMEQEKFYKGWMYTGDLGTWDENWVVTINGRKDDMIVCAGENIYPTQVEEALSGFDRVADSIVTCVPDKVRGQAVVAYVIAADEDLTEKDVAAYCQSCNMLSVYKCPRWYRIVKELPYTATGKKMHFAAKQQAAQDLADGLLVRG